MSEKNIEGRFMATVKVGEKGQIVIPKVARDMFDIVPGETLLLLADVERGIAVMKYDVDQFFTDAPFQAKPQADKKEGKE